MIPETLAQVAELTVQGEPFDFCLRNFLDSFYTNPQAAALASEPPLLAKTDSPLGRIEDAYHAATAEWLAWKYNLSAPRWI